MAAPLAVMSMTSIMRKLLTLAIALLLHGLAQAGESYRVLVLHSYHAGLSWTDAVQRGIDDALRDAARDTTLEVSLHIEYMDALRFRAHLGEVGRDLRQSLTTKFGKHPPDAILVSDNDAFDFMIAARDEIAPGVPIIFCGINGLKAYPGARLQNTTGVAEEASFGDTLNVMEALFPGRRVLVVGDKSATFAGNLEGLRRANSHRATATQIEVFDDPALSRIETRVRALGPQSLVFFMARPVDDQGKTVPIAHAVRVVSQASTQPVFSGWDFMLGHGIVGGRLISAEMQGRMAAQHLASVLRGTPAREIPIIWDSPNRYLFDYRELERFGHQNASLPEGSVVVNRPVSFYETNRDKVLYAALAFIVLLLVIVFLMVEVMRRRQAELRLTHVATHDALTGLVNRGLLQDRFLQASALAQRNHRQIACLFLDLDHFKEINDSLGHGIGDKLLQEVSLRLGQHVRDSDMVCRLGGDEFLVLLNHLESVQEAAAKAIQFASALQAPFQVGGNTLTISLSIGISVFPSDSQDFESLLRNADLAMYEAKRSGRNGYRFFDASMNSGIQRRMQVNQLLTGAHLRGEMALHLQPQFSLADGRLIGAEALLRWTSPVLGPVSPVEFITLAESSGQIVALGAWVFEEAVRIVASWQQAGYEPIPLAVNVSVAQLRRAEFYDSVVQVLQRHGVAPGRIEIEITESVFMDNVPEIAANLKAMEKLGMPLAIDDFGTGYSNLAYLKQTSASRLKIDRSFVKDILQDQNDAEIVRAIIQIGRSLGMQTLAEGVEEQAQADELAALGCEAMQGYLRSPAVTEQAFLGFFKPV